MTSPADPCLTCTWSAERQSHCFNKNHVKIYYSASDRGAWSLGSKFILKDRGLRHPTDEIPNVRFVKEQTSINVLTILANPGEEEDGHALTLMKRVAGEPLSEAWPKLSAEERENIAKQTAEALLELRELQSDRIQGLGGGSTVDHFLFRDPLASDDELWRQMESALPPSVSDSARARLQRTMAPARPYTFMHVA
ncbi:uncharacterized protein BDV17DRAFT_275658 [Aspergillus undulatus]|uniref:uncharacterized protein n=1 Tax=Aspergillus undulatus TaxID=1810928 RepID=UPI003CCD827C